MSRSTERTPSYEELLWEAAGELERAGVPEASLDAWYILEDTFGISRADYLWKKRESPPSVPGRFYERLALRAERMPLAYVLGSACFMGLPFMVEPGVLIPRQDTETLVEWVLEEGRGRAGLSGRQVLDMCTGSGCIGLSLARLGGCEVTLSDLSSEALSVAGKNARALGVEAGIFSGDLFEGLPSRSRYDVIVSNPPYIASGVIDGLQREVREYEPRMALDGQEDGLYFSRRLAAEAPGWLRAGGRLYLEIGYDQGAAVQRLLVSAGFEEVGIRKDLAGLDRVVRGVYRDV